jgi:hypothetical protein
MVKVYTLLLFFILNLHSTELVVVGDKNFPETNLTHSEIRAIFLDKKRFIKNEKILVMNHKVNHPLRLCFEKNILEKTERSLERYWRKAYYQGKRPPKIVSSLKMLFLYLDSVHPAIGYSDFNSTLHQEVVILYRVECGF